MTSSEHTRLAGRTQPLLSDWLAGVCDLDPEAVAFTFEDRDFPWSYIGDAIRDLNDRLAEHRQAQRVGIILRNRPGPLAAVIATIATGRQVVTLSPHLGETGLAEDIVAQQPDAVIAEAEDWDREPVSAAVAEIAAVPLICSEQRVIETKTPFTAPRPAGLPMDDVAVLMMTSGTTGKPKRVELTYAQLTSAFNAAGTHIDDQHEPRLQSGPAILWASLAHISGLYFAIAHAAEGRTVALMERFDIERWSELIRRHRPRYVRLPPAAIRMVLEAEVPAETFQSVRAIGSGTAQLSPDLAEAFEERYEVPVLVMYGATEFAGAIAGWSLTDHHEWGTRKRGSVGRAHDGVELRIIDPETYDFLPTGKVGLLEARGPQLPNRGEDWVRTTDLASLDEDGFLFIHGRADDAINRGGFKIPPSVIEDALNAHPSVHDSVAIGLPDERLGEVPAVAVVLREQASERELMDYLSERLTRYQMPVTLQVLDQFPRTPSMKISRPQVRDLVTAALTPETSDDRAPSPALKPAGS